MRQALLLALLANFFTPCIAQQESNPLKNHEVQLLSLLLDDSINNTNFIVNNSFNFGLGNDLFTNSNIIKKGKDLYIQPLGTGRLYKAIKENAMKPYKNIFKLSILFSFLSCFSSLKRLL